jgi:hypothetical protein
MPTDELESELRRILARTATGFESLDQARQRLLRRDYRPRGGNRRLATGIVAGAASVALVLGLGLSAVIGSASHQPSHQPSHPVHAQLAAWTVVEQADGTVLVTIRQFRDPAGLQRELRADGVPASIIVYPGTLPPGEPLGTVLRTLSDVKNNPCQAYSGGQGQLLKVVPATSPPQLGQIIIVPSALPSDAGVQFIATSNFGPAPSAGSSGLLVWLIQAGQQCTGG